MTIISPVGYLLLGPETTETG